MYYETLLAEELRVAGYDLSKMSDVQLAEVNRLARAARVELPRPGAVWGSHRDAERYGHEATSVDSRRPRPPRRRAPAGRGGPGACALKLRCRGLQNTAHQQNPAKGTGMSAVGG